MDAVERLMGELEQLVAGMVGLALTVTASMGDNGANSMGFAGMTVEAAGWLGLLTASRIAGFIGGGAAGAVGAVVRSNILVR